MTMDETVTVTVTFQERGPGNHTTIVESPWAEALAVIDGLATARDNATYRNVRFGRELQRKLTIYLRCDFSSSHWDVIRRTGRGPYTFTRAYLDSILAAAAKIEDVIARAVPAGPDYVCAAARDGCRNRVKVKGDYCSSCAHDAD
jgi:hypothetical protein